MSNRIRYANPQYNFFPWLKDLLNIHPDEFTAVCFSASNQYCWGGQISHDQKNGVAWFTWLTGGDNASTANLSVLLEYLIRVAGEAGMRRCAVTLDEGNWVISAFRQEGFGVFARQSIWYKSINREQYSEEAKGDETVWQSVTIHPFNEYDHFYESQITPSIRGLGSNWDKGNIFAAKKDNVIQATAKVSKDHNSRIYLEPIFHPGVENPANLIFQLAGQLVSREEKEIYVLIPGFQAWISEAFAQEGFQPINRQIIFVKNLAVGIEDETRKQRFEPNFLQPAGPGQMTITKKDK